MFESFLLSLTSDLSTIFLFFLCLHISGLYGAFVPRYYAIQWFNKCYVNELNSILSLPLLISDHHLISFGNLQSAICHSSKSAKHRAPVSPCAKSAEKCISLRFLQHRSWPLTPTRPKADWPLQIGVRDRRTHRQKNSRAQEGKSRKFPRTSTVTLVTRQQYLRKDPGSFPVSLASTAFTAGPHLDGKRVQRIRGHQ